jgi:hypothetical protein
MNAAAVAFYVNHGAQLTKICLKKFEQLAEISSN